MNTNKKFQRVTKIIIFLSGFALLVAGAFFNNSSSFRYNSSISGQAKDYDFYAIYNQSNPIQPNYFANKAQVGFQKIRIDTLPNHSDITLNGSKLSVGNEVNSTDLNKLAVFPNIDEYDNFKWSALDGENILSTTVTKFGVGARDPDPTPASFVTVAVEKYTTNHLPNITGTCRVGDTMVFTIKKGNTGIVSETITKLCNVSPYSLNPTILLPDGKYKVGVSVTVGGCTINNTIEGTAVDDTITGTTDNDLINGNGGSDTLNGGLGCDTIYAGNANNSTGGFTFINGDAGNDTIYGSNGQCDQILVQFKSFNKLQELTSFLWPISVNAQQNLCTPLQSYTPAVNLLNGTNDTLFGFGELDKLIGSQTIGTDYFYLSSDQGTYYAGEGDSDYAEIRNFECATDFILLRGTPGDYNITYSGNVASIYFLNTNGGQDLISKVDGFSSGLNPSDVCFNYLIQD